MTLLPLGIITMLYSFPLYKKDAKLFRLREVPLAKIFIISFVWSATSILLPVIQAEIKMDAVRLSILIVERFLFVFAITVPFDIRDMQSDKKMNVVTLPLLVGERGAIRIANAALFAFMVITLLHYFEYPMMSIALILSALISLFVLNNKKVRANTHYHYGILDGMMILQGLFVIGLNAF